MIKRNKLVSSFLGTALLVLAGCGQKGPLYLQEEPVQTNQPTETPEEKQKEQK